MSERADGRRRGRGRCGRWVQLSTAENKSYVEAFLGRMEAAAEDDAEANAHGRPAIHKLQLLRQV